jgi:uncharacterized protein YjiK
MGSNHPRRGATRRRAVLVLVAGLVLALALQTFSCLSGREELEEIIAPKAVAEIPQNLSGLTWNPETGTLFAVTNNPEYAFELTTDGKVLRTIRLEGFKDTEGITHIEGSLFAVVEERKGRLCIFHISAGAAEIDHDDTVSLELGRAPAKNKGFEGLSYDPATRTLFTLREGKPYVRLAITLDERFRPDAVRSEPLPALRVKDVASIVVDTDGSLWVLSEASARVVHLSANGGVLGSFRLPVDRKSFQPEGITLGTDDRIFVVGEPNILAVYRKPMR